MRNKESDIVKIIKFSGLSVAAVSSTVLFPTGLYLMGHGIIEADAPDICYGVLSAAAGVGLPFLFGNTAVNYYRSLRDQTYRI
ncbi:hypothetical protein COU60_01755 [Candidatus Pacearchaeota archaeon CG10_big_fil_rev_8_21_14_0_10_34_76]|nr:MAG: hypothetical protein COU60_01755 [Candidatus Pacearchaeota archaeon CG10_big_fil_rev_8_21_14_0_10_34_76]